MGFYVGCELSVSEINYPNLILGSNPDFPRVSPSLQIYIPCFLVQGWTAAVPWHWLRHRSRTQTPPSLRSSVAPPHPPRGITRLRFVALFSDHFLTRHWVALPGIVYIKMLEKNTTLWINKTKKCRSYVPFKLLQIKWKKTNQQKMIFFLKIRSVN